MSSPEILILADKGLISVLGPYQQYFSHVTAVTSDTTYTVILITVVYRQVFPPLKSAIFQSFNGGDYGYSL